MSDAVQPIELNHFPLEGERDVTSGEIFTLVTPLSTVE